MRCDPQPLEVFRSAEVADRAETATTLVGMTGAEPSVFISYSHDDKAVAVALHEQLQQRGLQAWIDERELRVGDSIIERVATAVADADFFLALVSPASIKSKWCRKELHLAITGELGREGVTVVPVRIGGVQMPDTLKDVLYLDLEPGDVEAAAERLTADLLSHAADRADGPLEARDTAEAEDAGIPRNDAENEEEPIRIIGVVREGIGEPLNDGSAGSALYRVPLRLSRTPSDLWVQVFEQEWGSQLYTMLRDAYVEGDTIVFPATTMDEIERHHLAQLRSVIDRVNQRTDEVRQQQNAAARRQAELRAQQKREHEQSIERVMERLSFDD